MKEKEEKEKKGTGTEAQVEKEKEAVESDTDWVQGIIKTAEAVETVEGAGITVRGPRQWIVSSSNSNSSSTLEDNREEEEGIITERIIGTIIISCVTIPWIASMEVGEVWQVQEVCI